MQQANQDYFIYPVVKQAVRWLSWMLAALSVVCALLLLLSQQFRSIGHFPVTETYCLAKYFASLLLLILAPWCINVLLAGRGTQLIRLYGYAGWLLIPLGLLISGFQAPIREIFLYYIHLLQGGQAFEDGYLLMGSLQNAAMISCFYLAVLGLLAYPYASGYGKRRQLLYWSILMLATGVADIIFALVPLSPEGKFILMLLLYLKMLLLFCYWWLTARFGLLLAKYTPLITGLPEKNAPIINKKRNG